MIGRRMNFIKTDEDIQDILWLPYAYEKFNPEDIQQRMNLLVPENMYAIFHSQLVQKEMDSNPEKFTTERFYTKNFTMEEFSQEFMDKIGKIMPEEGMKLGNAPPNTYMPKAENLKSMKKERVNPDKPGIPIRLENDNGIEIWYK